MNASSDAATEVPALHHVGTAPPTLPCCPRPVAGHRPGLFDAQARALADRFRVIRFDLRGHGGSPVVPGPYGVADLADDVLRLLDRLVSTGSRTPVSPSAGRSVSRWP